MSTPSIPQVAVRDAMVPVIAGQSFFQSLRSVGTTVFELNVLRDGSFPHIILEDGSAPYSLKNVDELKKKIDEEGVSVCAPILGTDFSGDIAAQDIEWAVESIQAAHTLGAAAIRIDPATARRELPLEAVAENVVRALNEILARTANTNVSLGLENHGVIANDPVFLNSIFSSIPDPRLGLTLDTGNFYWSGMPISELYKTVETFAPYARHTHMKSIAYPAEMRDERREAGYEYMHYAAPVDKGDIDMNRIAQILVSAGYKGALCVENETMGNYTPEEGIEVLKGEVNALRSALEAATA
jgi:sugar phosphate isomerase/epimerase